MKIRFPRRRKDGSFDLLLRLRTSSPRQQLEAWVTEWAQLNPTWQRRWKGGGRVEVETLIYTDEFSGPPTLEMCADGTVGIRFRVRPTSKMWKDWIVKALDDRRKEYDGDVTLLGIDSITD